MQLELFIWIYRFSVWNQVLVACVFFVSPLFLCDCVLFYILIKSCFDCIISK